MIYIIQHVCRGKYISWFKIILSNSDLKRCFFLCSFILFPHYFTVKFFTYIYSWEYLTLWICGKYSDTVKIIILLCLFNTLQFINISFFPPHVLYMPKIIDWEPYKVSTTYLKKKHVLNTCIVHIHLNKMTPTAISLAELSCNLKSWMTI